MNKIEIRVIGKSFGDSMFSFFGVSPGREVTPRSQLRVNAGDRTS